MSCLFLPARASPGPPAFCPPPAQVRIECKGETDDQFERGASLERWGLVRALAAAGPVPAQDLSHTSATHMRYRGVLVAGPRDFVTASGWRVAADGTLLVVAWSAPHAAMPEAKGTVRAHLEIGGWVVRPRRAAGAATAGAGATALDLDADGCDCTYLMRADFKGNIPTMVTRTVAAQQSGIVAKLRTALDKRYKGDAGAAALAAARANPLVNLDEEAAAAAAASS